MISFLEANAVQKAFEPIKDSSGESLNMFKMRRRFRKVRASSGEALTAILAISIVCSRA